MKVNKNKKWKKFAGLCLAAFLSLSLAVVPGTVYGSSVSGSGGENITTAETEGLSDSESGAVLDKPKIEREMGESGRMPIYAEDLQEGTYEIDVDSSSSMFRVVDCQLTVKDGAMTAVMTLGGTGYLKLYMGTKAEAESQDETAFVPFVENEDGAYTYTVSVPSLDATTDCAAFSKRKQKWYDRVLIFETDRIPDEAYLVQRPDYEAIEAESRAAAKAEEEAARETAETVEQVVTDLKDGVYTIEVEMTGGTGRAEIVNPVSMTVVEGRATALLQWSSDTYDYMLVNHQKYLPVNTEGNSVFEIPVLVFDEDMTVVADTVAMSTAHEIAYKLNFKMDTAKREGSVSGVILVIVPVIAGVGIFLFLAARGQRRKKPVRKDR